MTTARTRTSAESRPSFSSVVKKEITPMATKATQARPNPPPLKALFGNLPRSVSHQQKSDEHERGTLRAKRRPVRSQDDLGQPLRLDPHPLQPRAHDDVLAAHGDRADRLRLRDRPVLRPLAADA